MTVRDNDSCRNCLHFNALAADIELSFPGLASLSSAYSSVRAEDGLCRLNDRYLAASSVCNHHSREICRPVI
jgi:hypothetical protein